MENTQDISNLNMSKGLKIGHWNVHSMMCNIDQFRCLLQGSNIDIITVSESWLQPHLHTHLVEVEGFKAYRQDRRAGSKTKTKTKTKNVGAVY